MSEPLRWFTVSVVFSWEGLVGRERYVVPRHTQETAEAACVGMFERALIEQGASTWECGCCVNDERVTVLSVEVDDG